MKTKKDITKRFASMVLAATMALTTLLTPMQVNAAPLEVSTPAIGIDVSRYQGEIDWDQVKAAGVQFAIIRVGYRTQTTGVLTEDPYARYNLQEANRVGIKTGVYFFSTAINAVEAVEEATWVANLIDKYSITYPVAYDCEGYEKKSSRHYSLTKDQRTALAITFMDTIAARGYTPMFYASKNALTDNNAWNTTALQSKYKIWLAYYPKLPFPQTVSPEYNGLYSIWQYSCKARIAGISEEVDMNLAYFDYTEIAQPKDPSGAPHVNATDCVQYMDVLDVVTPNTTVNVRTVPSTDDPSTIVLKLNPGDMIYRTGVGNNGWSKIVLGDKAFYIYSTYLDKVL